MKAIIINVAVCSHKPGEEDQVVGSFVRKWRSLTDFTTQIGGAVSLTGEWLRIMSCGGTGDDFAQSTHTVSSGGAHKSIV